MFLGQLRVLKYGVGEIVPEEGKEREFADCFVYTLPLYGIFCLYFVEIVLLVAGGVL